MTLDVKTTLKIEEPARKWQHATLEIEVPQDNEQLAGWLMDYEYGKFHLVPMVDVLFDDARRITGIRLGLRRSVIDAVEATP